LTVSDQAHLITAIPSESCVEYFNKTPGSLAKAKGGVVELLDYDIIFTNENRDIVLFITKVNWVGCQESDIFGDPVELLTDPKIKQYLKNKIADDRERGRHHSQSPIPLLEVIELLYNEEENETVNRSSDQTGTSDSLSALNACLKDCIISSSQEEKLKQISGWQRADDDNTLSVPPYEQTVVETNTFAAPYIDFFADQEFLPAVLSDSEIITRPPQQMSSNTFVSRESSEKFGTTDNIQHQSAQHPPPPPPPPPPPSSSSSSSSPRQHQQQAQAQMLISTTSTSRQQEQEVEECGTPLYEDVTFSQNAITSSTSLPLKEDRIHHSPHTERDNIKTVQNENTPSVPTDTTTLKDNNESLCHPRTSPLLSSSLQTNSQQLHFLHANQEASLSLPNAATKSLSKESTSTRNDSPQNENANCQSPRQSQFLSAPSIQKVEELTPNSKEQTLSGPVAPTPNHSLMSKSDTSLLEDILLANTNNNNNNNNNNNRAKRSKFGHDNDEESRIRDAETTKKKKSQKTNRSLKAKGTKNQSSEEQQIEHAEVTNTNANTTNDTNERRNEKTETAIQEKNNFLSRHVVREPSKRLSNSPSSTETQSAAGPPTTTPITRTHTLKTLFDILHKTPQSDPRSNINSNKNTVNQNDESISNSKSPSNLMSTLFERKASVPPPSPQHQNKSIQKNINNDNNNNSKKRKVNFLEWLVPGSANKKPRL
jgi:hypothetical protein